MKQLPQAKASGYEGQKKMRKEAYLTVQVGVEMAEQTGLLSIACVAGNLQAK